jgi:hypothetical protein
MAAEGVPLVIVDDRGLRWAVFADAVREIVATSSWQGDEPLDVAGIWEMGLAQRWALARAPATARALVVRTRSGERALLSPRVSFRTVERAAVLPLPEVLARGAGGDMISGIVFGESEQPLVIVNPDGFLERKGDTG